MVGESPTQVGEGGGGGEETPNNYCLIPAETCVMGQLKVAHCLMTRPNELLELEISENLAVIGRVAMERNKARWSYGNPLGYFSVLAKTLFDGRIRK